MAVYTSCRRTGPFTIAKMRRLHERFAASGVAAEFVLVTLDPEGDTKDVLHEFRSSQDLPSSWHILRGTPEATADLADLLGIHVLSMGEHILHDARIAVFRPDGLLVRRFACCDFDEADAMSAALIPRAR
jgi:cytochrome oxidase Cu insertion factor (SCO1/SenC/PrrC family)